METIQRLLEQGRLVIETVYETDWKTGEQRIAYASLNPVYRPRKGPFKVTDDKGNIIQENIEKLSDAMTVYGNAAKGNHRWFFVYDGNGELYCKGYNPPSENNEE